MDLRSTRVARDELIITEKHFREAELERQSLEFDNQIKIEEMNHFKTDSPNNDEFKTNFNDQLPNFKRKINLLLKLNRDWRLSETG
jgi:hypothetical protein